MLTRTVPRVFPRIAPCCCARRLATQSRPSAGSRTSPTTSATLLRRQPWAQPRRTKRTLTARQAIEETYRTNPLSMTFGGLIILAICGIVGYQMYIYQKYVGSSLHNYPDPVAKRLRHALYYSNVKDSPQDAVKQYHEAIRVANELGMDPFSDEVMGIKIELAAYLERLKLIPRAVRILEIIRQDNLRWMKERAPLVKDKSQRTRVLMKTVGVSIKLGELYDLVGESDKAEEQLVWAVETVLKEQTRRQEDGVEEGEGDWMSNEETGATFEALADKYEASNKHRLSAPLYLQALALNPAPSCHAVVLMNNLAISLAQQSAPGSFFASSDPTSIISGTPTLSPSPSPPPIPSSQDTATPPTRAQLVSNATAWSQKALAMASKIQPPQRTPECDVGCAVATHNLGEFVDIAGDVAEATRRYQEAESLSRAVGFEDGVRKARERLEALEARGKGKDK